MTLSALTPEEREAFEERAAIIAEGCKVSRAESERMAMEMILSAREAKMADVQRTADALRAARRKGGRR